MIDRGFIKWQPFNSITPLKDTIKSIREKETWVKPTLFPEEIKVINDAIMEAYYAKNMINIVYYEENKIKKIKSFIKKINPSSKVIELGCGKKIYWKQIIHVDSYE